MIGKMKIKNGGQGQLYQRKAERSAGEGDYMKAVDTLQALKSAFEGIPDRFVDRLMLQKLQRAKSIARGCSRNVGDGKYKRLAGDLENWFGSKIHDAGSASATAEDVFGQIVRWFPDRKFGFIAGPDGKEYFFHFSAVISPHVQEDVHQGARVVFNPEKDIRGDRAANVELINVMQ
jgi:cold shock protein